MNVVCYIRYNRTDDYLKDVIERAARLIIFCRENGYVIKSVVAEQRSGMTPYSEILKRIIKWDDVQGIVVTDISGLTRDLITQIQIYQDMYKHNKKPISLNSSCEQLYKSITRLITE